MHHNRRLTWTRRAIILACALPLALPAVAQAAPAAATRLAGSIVPLTRVSVLGEAAATAPVRFHIQLRLRNMDELAASVTAGKRLTPAQLFARHFPTQADYDAVTAWVKAQGLTVARTVPTRMMVDVTGTAAAAAAALDAHFVRIRAEGRDWVAADTAPAIPAALAATVIGINGLQPHLGMHTTHIRGKVTPAFSGYLPANLRVAYGAKALTQTGAGTTTAILIDTSPYASDLTAFWSGTGTKQSLANVGVIAASVTPYNQLPPPSGEESIDVEMSSSMAPGSKVRIYATGTLKFTDIDNGYEAMVLDAVSGVALPQVSVSLGACEPATSVSQVLTDIYYHAILGSLGSTILISSGDSGSEECYSAGSTKNYASFDSTSPYVTAVGGTHLVINGTTVTETAWSGTGKAGGSGGGLSVYFPSSAFPTLTAPYQSGLGLASRGVPDISAVGDPATGVAIILNGSVQVYGGTSVAAPVCAGLLGLVNQARAAAGKSSLGPLNSRVYPLLKSANFRDIKSGNNGGYTAKVGYDLVTGIGSPLLNKLLATLVAQN